MANGVTAAQPRRQRPAPLIHTVSDTATANLSTNNPFRRVSPLGPPPPIRRPSATPQTSLSAVGPDTALMSRNPFLDSAALQTSSTMAVEPGAAAAKLADDIFSQPSPIKRPSVSSSQRSPNMSPTKAYTLNSVNGTSRSPVRKSPLDAVLSPNSVTSQHRPSGSGPSQPQERRPSRPLPNQAIPSLVSVEKPSQRRNSESSINNVSPVVVDTQQKDRGAERAKREKDGKTQPLKRSRRVDLIDQLDGSNILGPMHHGGPFDACTTWQNKKQNAPLAAFAEGSANNSIAGKAPLSKPGYVDITGLEIQESYIDFSATAKSAPRDDREDLPSGERKTDWTPFINPTDRVDQIHGEESNGLGTSTFLEGATAPPSAQRGDNSSDIMQMDNSPGLSRKPTLVNRLNRAMSAPKRPVDLGNTGQRSGSLNNGYAAKSPFSPPLPSSAVAHSAGGPARMRADPNKNPFFDSSYSGAYVPNPSSFSGADGGDVGLADRTRTLSDTAPAPITRSMTSDSAPRQASVGSSNGGRGFIGRMRSFRQANRRPVVGIQEGT